MDDEQRYRAIQSRDARFDGAFVTAVTSTGIYCRPSCPAVTPKRANVVFHPTPAAAQQAGFRACKRCRPDAAPGSAPAESGSVVAGRALRLIADGVVDRDGVPGLAGRLGYSERQVHRHLLAEVGAGVAALARAQRAATARTLLTATDLPVTQVAVAAGFASVRQFNDTIRAVYASTPSGLRGSARGGGSVLTLHLSYRRPFAGRAVLDFLGRRAVAGVEEYDGQRYRRSLRLPYGAGVVELALPAAGTHVVATLTLEDLRDVTAATARCRRLLDLDADPAAVDAHLATDPALAPLVAATPGLRSPGAVDAGELAVRAVLGQQVSVAAARTLAGRLVDRLGEPLPGALRVGAVTHLFPAPERIAAGDVPLPMPRARWACLTSLAGALAQGRLSLEPGCDPLEAERALLALPGIGPWTAGYVRLRALGEPDAFLPTDLGVRQAAARLTGSAARALDARAVSAMAARWAPWRAYALHHLWRSLAAPSSREETP